MRRKLEPPLEKKEEAAIVQAYRAAGCTVVRFAQPRATMQTEGIPDLRVYDERTGTAWWHEVKRKRGPGWKVVKSGQTRAQREFQRLCESCGEEYLLGATDVALRKLKAIGRIV